MRGKRLGLLSLGLGLGLIPAHAGKTRPRGTPSQTERAHPRACGENGWCRHLRCGVMGSSPRMRGKPQHLNCSHRFKRLIPAHAGKTSRAAATWISHPAHPRACGENPVFGFPMLMLPGSSPRMRGKLAVVEGGQVNRGLIPAHAGKTSVGVVAGILAPAHPRACGENPTYAN